MLRTYLLAAVLILTAITFAIGDTSLNEYIAAKMSEGRMPGLSIAIIKDGRIVRVNGFGCADISKKVRVTPDTIFLMASADEMSALRNIFLRTPVGLLSKSRI